MTHKKMHLHLFGKKCANQHQYRTAKGKKNGVGYFTFASWEPLSNGSLHSPTPFGETQPEHWTHVFQKNVPHCPLETPFRLLGSVS